MSRADGSGGFALTEIMIALVLLAIGLLSLVGVMLGTSQRMDRTSSQADFAAAGESKVEDLWAAAFARNSDTLALTIGGSLTADETDHWDVFTNADGRQFRRRWLVEEGPAETRSVTIRVTAESGRAVARRDYRTLVRLR